MVRKMKGKLYFVYGYYSSQNQNIEITGNTEIIRDRMILMRNDINNVYNVQTEDISIHDQEYISLTEEYIIYDGNSVKPGGNNPMA